MGIISEEGEREEERMEREEGGGTEWDVGVTGRADGGEEREGEEGRGKEREGEE